MNFLRSVFITALPVYLAVVSLVALVQLVRGADPLISWLGLALSALGPLSFFAWVLLARPVRTVRHPVEFSVICALGLALTLALSFRHGEAAGSIHLWAGVSLIAWIAYLRWYSPFPNRTSHVLAAGKTLPDFSLQDVEGETVKSSSFRRRSHVLLFYRGNWCPFCTAQIRELAEKYRDIEKAGAAVVLVSPQPLSEHAKLARKLDLPMRFMRDAGNHAARQLGIHVPWGTPMGLRLLGHDSDTVLPTVVITDPDGTIIYSHLTDNYRIRPEPEEYLVILEGAVR